MEVEEFKKNNGRHKIDYPNGDIYDGELRNGNWDCQGMLSYKDGGEYEG